MATFSSLPPEILQLITKLVYLDHLPRSVFRCIDPHGLPSSYQDGRLISSTQASTQRTLHSLCLVNRACYAAARPLLFRRLQITLPASFLLLLRTLGAAHLADAYEEFLAIERVRAAEDDDLRDTTASSSDDDDDMATEELQRLARLEQRRARAHMSFNAMIAAAGFARATGSKLYVSARRGDKLRRTASLQGRGGGTRQSGPRTIEDRNPRAENDAAEAQASMQLVWTEELGEPGSTPRYALTLVPSAPHVFTEVHHFPRVLDFSTFTSQGLRRKVGEGETARFVTPSKLLALITACDGLMAFGASHTMDSALTKEVLEALLFRDGKLSRPSRLRGVSVERPRRDRSIRRLESLDLCGCVSPRFQEALRAFVDEHLRKFSGRVTDTVAEESEDLSTTEAEEEDEDDEAERGRGRGREQRGTGATLSVGASTHGSSASRSLTRTRSASAHRGFDDEAPSYHPARATRFPSLHRLGLASLTFPTDLLTPFVLAFPRLTHLDLSGTRADASLLKALGASPTVSLECLSLARCRHITSESVTDLLVDSPVTAELAELSLEGTMLFPTPISSEDLTTILTSSPCFRSGRLRYLDLGGCGVTDAHLTAIHPQPCLIDLGFASTPDVTLEALSDFLIRKAPNVQVLELSDSCTPVGSVISVLRLNTALLEPCTGVPPIPLSLQLAMMGFAPLPPMPGGHDGSGMDVDEDGKASKPTMPPMPQPATNLRVVGLSPAGLRAMGGGTGGWRVIWGSGRRGWFVDTSSGPNPDAVDAALMGDAGVGARHGMEREEEEEEEEDRSGGRGFGTDELRGRVPSVGPGSPWTSRGRASLVEERERERSRGRSTSARRRGVLPKHNVTWQPESPPVRSPAISPGPGKRFAQGAASGLGSGAGGSSLRRAASVSQSRSRSRAPAIRSPLGGAALMAPEMQRGGSAGSTTSGGRGNATTGMATLGLSSSSSLQPVSDTSITDVPLAVSTRHEEVIRCLPSTHPRTKALQALADAQGHVPGSTGWHSRKMEVLFGFGMLGREQGAYCYWAFQS